MMIARIANIAYADAGADADDAADVDVDVRGVYSSQKLSFL